MNNNNKTRKPWWYKTKNWKLFAPKRSCVRCGIVVRDSKHYESGIYKESIKGQWVCLDCLTNRELDIVNEVIDYEYCEMCVLAESCNYDAKQQQKYCVEKELLKK